MRQSAKLCVLLLVCMSQVRPATSLLESMKEWLFGKSGVSDDPSGDGVVLKAGKVMFEVPTADSKFLQLKDALDNLTPLDACYHIVVYNLKKRCGELSEEDLGKLSVQLFNCQSAAEERPTYSCTDEMSLAECTRDMDSTVWNSYHIVSNRARSLCYATQQHQFRKLAEVTVNRLVSTAHEQLEYMQQLQNGQEQLHLLTTDTVRKLYESQTELVSTQQALHSSQGDVLDHIHDNMQQLMTEKALISAGNKELAELTENIRDKLDKTAQHFMEQDSVQTQTHQRIIEDLTNIQRKSQDGLKKLDESSEYLMRNHQEMMSHYQVLYDNMVKINSTVSHVLATVKAMQEHLEERISWFSRLVNMADDKLTLLTCGVYHISFFMLAALTASFLQVPSFSRLVLVLMVTLNAGMEVQSGHCLDFTSLSLFMLLVSAGNWLVVLWCRRRNRSKADRSETGPASLFRLEPSPQTVIEGEGADREPAVYSNTPTAPLTPLELRQLNTTLNQLSNSLNESMGPRGDNSSRQPDTNLPSTSTSTFSPVGTSEQVRPDSSTMDGVTKVRRFLLENLEDNSSVSSFGRSSTPRLRTSTPHRPSSRGSSNSSRCHGFTKSGIACRLSSVRGTEFCHKHQNPPS